MAFVRSAEAAERTPPEGSPRAPASGRQPWVSPKLVRIAAVSDVTSKVDKKGRKDGGSGKKRRT
ncbi:MAG: hypothetical protein ACYC7F_06820 [Gemmatimonadaceae bacterium]